MTTIRLRRSSGRRDRTRRLAAGSLLVEDVTRLGAVVRAAMVSVELRTHQTVRTGVERRDLNLGQLVLTDVRDGAEHLPQSARGATEHDGDEQQARPSEGTESLAADDLFVGP